MTARLEELSFTYFPENYRWSHGLLIGLNMAPWGGAEIGEVNRIGLRLKNRVGDDDAWFREWVREARTVEDARARTHRRRLHHERRAIPAPRQRLLPCWRAFSAAEEQRGARRLYARRCVLPGRGQIHQAAAHGACRNSLRRHQPAGGLRPCRAGEFVRQGAGGGVFRRARCHQGDSVFQRRGRSGRPRHCLPDRRRARQRRKHPLSRSLFAARHRALRDAGL